MKLTIRPTDEITTLDGQRCRVWQGTTSSGRPVQLFILRIGSADPEAQAELEGALIEMGEPREVSLPNLISRSRAIDGRMIF